MRDIWLVVMATAHRPQHLKDLGPDCVPWCRRKLADGARWLRDERGCEVGISGMALGVDLRWARAVLDAGLVLWAFVPFPEQPDVWPDRKDRDEWARLISLAADVKYAGSLEGFTGDARKKEAVRLLHKRNDMMLDASAAVVAVLDSTKTSGGTASAVRKARLRGLPGVHLDPRTRTVRLGLPDVRRVAA